MVKSKSLIYSIPFSGCYAMPSIEVNTTLKSGTPIGTVLVPWTSKSDPATFCRDRCSSKLQNQYFVLLETQSKCQCVPKVPLGGNYHFTDQKI